MKFRASLCWVGQGIVLGLVLLCDSVQADSWAPAGPLDALSENGEFTAHVTPGSTISKPTVVVSSIKAHQTNVVWRATLSNRECPTEVLLSDDGTSVVTLDNWAGVGYGNDVVAIYEPRGQKAKYSLEEFAPPPKPPGSFWQDFSFSKTPGSYYGLFPSSAGSRWWRNYSIYFFYHDGRNLLFCLWLDWDQRWVVWKMSDGNLGRVTTDLAKRLDTEGRRRALQQTQSLRRASAGLNFLAHLRRPEDRPVIEAWLRDTEYSTGWECSQSSTNTNFCFVAKSSKRQEAEKILQCWDCLATNISMLDTTETNRYLGSVKCQVTLNTAPTSGDGILRLYLVPTAVPFEKWIDSQPEHYLAADFKFVSPNVFILGKTIDFAFYGVTPGNYRVKAVWNKTPPYAKTETVVCIPHAGDYENTNSPVISVTRGTVVDKALVECTTPVGTR